MRQLLRRGDSHTPGGRGASLSTQRWILAAATVLFLWRLGGHDLWAPNEPYFAEGAREMVVDGHWAVPHVNGVVTTDKPPLIFWLIALCSLPFGEVTPLTARLPSALAAIGTLALTMRLGRRFYGPRTASLAGVILATTFMFWDQARWSQTDAVLCLLIWLALSAFEAFHASDLHGRSAGLLFWAAIALAVLDKGPVGLLIPVGIVLSVLTVDKSLARWRDFAPVSGPLLFVLLMTTWILVATYGDAGDYSVWGALREHFIDRSIHGLHHRQPFWYYLRALPASLLPWTGLLVGALVLAWRRRLPGDRFVLVAAPFVMTLFSISTEKREVYALPALPAIALMMAALVGSLAGWHEPGDAPATPLSQRWASFANGSVAVLLLLAGVALPFVAARPELRAEGAGPAIWLLGALLAATGAGTLYFAARRHALASTLAMAVGVAVVYLSASAWIYPLLEPQKSARSFTLRMKDVTAESRARGHRVVAFDLVNLPQHFAFYSDGVYMIETDDATLLERHFEQEDPVFAVVDGERLEATSPVLADRLIVVERTVLARKDVRLVTNVPPREETASDADR